MRFDDIPQMPRGSYMVHCEWRDLEYTLARWSERKNGLAALDIDPDFQRGHVWTEDQQRAYVEFKLQGGRAGSLILFNCVGWSSDYRGPFVLVDGKQRIEAVRKFMRSELPIFGGHRYCDFQGHLRSFNARFEFEVNNLETRADVLNWYLGLNSGGVVHTESELNRVRELLAKETP